MSSKRSLLLSFLFICCASLNAQDSIQYNLSTVKLNGNVNADSFNQMNQLQFQQLGVNHSAEALGYMAGVQATKVGDRNEQVVFVNGFDLRQVPLLLDGIPVYVPFDGYVDLGRFTVYDIASISVQKGFSSVATGPNALGGAINLISHKPSDKLEFKGMQGLLNNGFRSYLSVGQAKSKFYWLGSYSKFERSSFPVAQNFQSNQFENGGKRDNSFNDDQRLNLKFAFTPNKGHEHAFNLMYQNGEKGNPSYAGKDSLNPRFNKPRYWYWPYWNKTSVYYLGKMQFKKLGVLKARVFYDQFNNKLQSFDDATFRSQNKRYAFNSIYLDYSAGASATLKTNILKNYNLTVSGHFKWDEHNEKDNDEPWREMSDFTNFMGIENQIIINKNSSLIINGSYSVRKSSVAQNLLNIDGSFSSFSPNSSNALNLGALYNNRLKSNLLFKASLSRTSRFATIKDRYSYRLGTALPNPNLNPEMAVNLNTGLSGELQKWHFNISSFISSINNSLQQVERVLFDTASANWLSQQQNVGEAIFYGFNIGFQRKFKSGLSLNANYSFTERENLTLDNFRFTLVPKHSSNIILRFDNASKVNLQSVIRLQGNSYSTSYGTQNNAFAVINVQSEYEISKVFKLQANIENLLDVSYSLAEGFPEPGRVFNLTLLWNWSIN